MISVYQLNINEICGKFDIFDYKINDDKSIDVFENVDISNKGLYRIPINFRYVYGDFNCSNNRILSLYGCPKYVQGDFNCSNNELTHLKWLPDVGGDIDISKNFFKIN
jgi:hypothetical protein